MIMAVSKKHLYGTLLTSQFLKELEKNQNGLQDSPTSSTSYSAVRSTSLGNEISHRPRPSPHDERRPLLMRSYSTADLEGASAEYIGQGPVAGGTIMGIHNLAIVLPQFIIAIVASIIFRLADGDRRAAGSFEPPPNQPTPGYPGGPDPVYHEKSGVAWVLRFGGLMALVGAAVCRSVPPTKQEKVS
jgi:solute carrier family 45 protein 1/2/4